MASKIAQKAGMSVLERHLKTYEPKDPLYEDYVDERGVTQRRKRELPPGLSQRDQAILKKVKKRAHYLDKGFRICGFRFGWTFVIGMIPIVGDVTDAVLNYTLVVRVARKADLPAWLVSQMLFNNAISAACGFVPLAGDVVLAIWKANSRNAHLLEEFLRVRGEEYLKGPAGRSENPNEVKPGAGKVPGEYVDGKAQGTINTVAGPSTRSGSSFFGGKGKSRAA
ncbi:hypothetical protein FRC02_008633 [Tulasnella sp. 418]|nr:hypothetical protein FRC02_008633 [Tulasnella sp. 418]